MTLCGRRVVGKTPSASGGKQWPSSEGLAQLFVEERSAAIELRRRIYQKRSNTWERLRT